MRLLVLEDDPALRDTYGFNSRGTDTFVKASWDEANDYIARAMVAVAETYSEDEGRRRLEADGYQPEMVEATHGAGTRTMKFRGGMGLLGVIGKYGMYRFSNMMALLDTHVRGVDPVGTIRSGESRATESAGATLTSRRSSPRTPSA